MKLDLACVGHILYDVRCYVDHLPKPDKTAVIQSPIEASGGGSAANVAVNSAMLGMKAGIIGNVGSDHQGDFLLSNFRKFGVDVSQVKRFRGGSGTAIVVIDKSAEVEVIESIGVTERKRGIDEAYLQNAKFLHMSGTDLGLLKRASRIAKEKRKTVLFDPGRSRAREGEKKLAPILRNCDYLFANRRELLLIGGGSEPHESARRIAKKYALTCIVKGGKEELFITRKGDRGFSLSPPNVRPVDTIGAGDAFSAGFICGLKEGRDLRSCSKIAMWSAVQKILYRGAQSPISREWVRKKSRV